MSSVGALLLAVAELARIPPPVPPTTPTGCAELPEPLSDLLLLPIRMATPTPTINTAAMTAPMMTGLGPPRGVTVASFLEASGRMRVVSLSEQTMVKAVCRTRTNDEPRRTGYESHVAQYVSPILRFRGPDGSTTAETAAVNAQSAHPGGGDTDDEGQHHQTAHYGGHAREKTCDQQQPDQDLDHRQRVAHVGRQVIGKDLEGTNRQRGGRRRGHLQPTGHKEDHPEDQSGQQTDKVCATTAAVNVHELSAPFGRRQPARPRARGSRRYRPHANPRRSGRAPEPSRQSRRRRRPQPARPEHRWRHRARHRSACRSSGGSG